MKLLTKEQADKAFATMDLCEVLILLWWIFFNKRKYKIWTQSIMDGMSGVAAFEKVITPNKQ